MLSDRNDRHRKRRMQIQRRWLRIARTAPTVVANASANSAPLILGSLPSLSRKPAFVDTPISVPSVSNRSTNRIAKITTIKSKMEIPEKLSLPARCDAGGCGNQTCGNQGIYACFHINHINPCKLADDTQNPCNQDTNQKCALYLSDQHQCDDGTNQSKCNGNGLYIPRLTQ